MASCSYGAYKHNTISLENKPFCNYAAFTGPAHVLKSQRLETMKPCGRQEESSAKAHLFSGKSSDLASKSRKVRGPLAGRRPGVGAPPVRRGRWHARRREVVGGGPGRDMQKKLHH